MGCKEKKSLSTHYHEFLQDSNHDFDQKSLQGLVIGMIAIILSIICVIYGLGHEIKSSSLITTILMGLYGLCGSLLGLTAFSKQRIDVEDIKEDVKEENKDD